MGILVKHNLDDSMKNTRLGWLLGVLLKFMVSLMAWLNYVRVLLLLVSRLATLSNGCKNAFLYRDLIEGVYIEQMLDYVAKEKLICKVHNVIYKL